ncbi:crosslink repair DNA glycosylase YcaQ family protein [Undibacterium cyanobacteriorum]|uniref:Crosslink repair DNA glycosylase YcaQ family protein n=1 Tax=Undibacterium cyanobacteriorum TaxID=3073561 RepID=A0ABY9RF20_9BURK|nr:crosslink repair DNA glycosylase YcaQ family protein [Undibacterium sp. 20NA77.5]WMW79531.1 crosslink repair DNA glycosylase YcaQ family protein [Undibacterium sp. 20NA77.5]
MTLSLSAARNIHLAAQGLLTPHKKRASKQSVLDTIAQMGLLQIDTIHVVARSPYLVLWSRLGDYQPEWLDQHLAEGSLFEYWSHEACFLPIESFGRYRRQMLNPEGLGWKYNERWLRDNQQHVDHIIKHIKQFGECRSADFERQDGKSGGWWEWKPEKRSLEVLFTLGKVMVARRERFQRVYDLTERVHPTWNDKRDLRPLKETQQAQVLDAVKALGICKASWIGDYYRMKKLDAHLRPDHLVDQGLLCATEVDRWGETAYYHPAQQSLIEQAAAGQLRATHSSLLSPFDPVVWDRKRASDLFAFDYKLECYTPEAKRRYGYFCLPILRRGKLIGRLDAKAHRKQGVMEIKALYLEDGVASSDALAKDLAKTLQAFAAWHQTPSVKIEQCTDKALKKNLIALLKT